MKIGEKQFKIQETFGNKRQKERKYILIYKNLDNPLKRVLSIISKSKKLSLKYFTKKRKMSSGIIVISE